MAFGALQFCSLVEQLICQPPGTTVLWCPTVMRSMHTLNHVMSVRLAVARGWLAHAHIGDGVAGGATN